MPFINFTSPFAILIGVILFLLVLYLGRETKKAWIVGIMLFVFLGLLIGHTLEITMFVHQEDNEYSQVIVSIVMDLVFIFLSFISYLWIDDVETKLGKKKSIDNSLDWFWNKV